MAAESSGAYKPYPYSYSLPSSRINGPVLSFIAQQIRHEVAPCRFRLAAHHIVKELELNSSKKILEVGCGLGLLGEELQRTTKGKNRYVGIDLVRESATESHKRGLQSLQATVLNMPFISNSFDVLISTDVLEHVEDSEGAIREIARIVKPKGKAFIVIADPSEGRFNYVSGHIDRTKTGSDIFYWEELMNKNGFTVLKERSKKYRDGDWRKIFNLPTFQFLKNQPGFACAFDPVLRPGTYILQKN